jgi:WD40 repeat protein
MRPKVNELIVPRNQGPVLFTKNVRCVACVTLGLAPEHGDCLVVASGSYDCTVRVWNADTGSPLHERPFVGHSSFVSCVAMGILPADCKLVVASGGHDRSIRIWDVASGGLLVDPLAGHDEPVCCLAMGLSPASGRLCLVRGGVDGALRVWDVASGGAVQCVFPEPRFAATGLTLLTLPRSGRFVVVVVNSSGSLVAVDAITGSPVGDSRLTGHNGAVVFAGFGSGSGSQFVTTCAVDHTVRLWELEFDQEASESLGSLGSLGCAVSLLWASVGRLQSLDAVGLVLTDSQGLTDHQRALLTYRASS